MELNNLFLNKKGKKSESVAASDHSVENPASDNKKIRKKPQDDNLRTRREVLKLRLTEDEKELIAKKSTEANMSKTDFIMMAVNGAKIIVISNIPKLYIELLRQGNNLNQLLRIAYQTEAKELSSIAEAVKQCSETHKKLMRFCDYWDTTLKNYDKKKEN
ncbi:MAG: hypothetical protein IJD97_05600 [Clostridia bacterium]|nr:hypothetical protein [Clostridia bacterium]